MQNGAVWLSHGSSTKRLRRASKLLHAGEQIHVYYDPHIINSASQVPQLIADEGMYSVWHKPAGMFSQGTRYGDHCTVQRWAEKNLLPQRNAFIVHRLDRDAQGLLLLAHSKLAAAALSKLFQQRLIKKQYLVSVEGDMSDFKLPFDINTPLDGKEAATTILSTKYNQSSNQTELLIDIHTGRKHQIRKHLSSLGFAVVGDKIYGNSVTTNQATSLKLRAFNLRFTCPISNKPKHYEDITI